MTLFAQVLIVCKELADLVKIELVSVAFSAVFSAGDGDDVYWMAGSDWPSAGGVNES